MSDQTPSRGEQTRNQITATAYQLFLGQGYHGTSMRQIAEQAGIALGGIYNHFDNKEAIFCNVLQTYHPLHEILPDLTAVQASSLEQFVRYCAQRMVASITGRADFLNLIFIELVEFNAAHLPGLLETLLPQVTLLSQRLGRWQDELRPIPPLVLARAFIGLFFSYVMTELVISRQALPGARPAALDQFVDIYLHGILAGGSNHD